MSTDPDGDDVGVCLVIFDERHGRYALNDGEGRREGEALSYIRECTGRYCRRFSHGMTLSSDKLGYSTLGIKACRHSQLRESYSLIM